MSHKKKTRSKYSSGESATSVGKPNPPFFDIFRGVAYAVLLFVAGVAGNMNGFAGMWVFPSEPAERVIFFVRIGLFVELVVLAVRWIIATHFELELWLRWLENPLGRQAMYWAILGLAFVLGLLIAFPHKIAYISGFMTVYFLLNYWTQWLSNDHFSIALKETKRRHPGKARRRVLRAMRYFWLKRPQGGRVATMMFFSFVAFSLAFAGEFQGGQQRQPYQIAAYVVLFLDILIGEILIARWRYKLEQDIRQAVNSKRERRHVRDAR